MGYDSRDGYNYLRLFSTDVVTDTNAGVAGRWVFPDKRLFGTERPTIANH